MFLGSLSGKLLQLLDIDMHLDPNLASDDDDIGRQSRFLLLDRKYLKPFFTRLRPRTRIDEEPDLIDLEVSARVAVCLPLFCFGGFGGIMGCVCFDQFCIMICT